MTSEDPIPWDELSYKEKENFTYMLNRRFGASLSVKDAKEYYGNPDKVENELGKDSRNAHKGPECPECFTPLFQKDIPYMKRTGCCPNCGTDITK